jgi:pSer/pThr/pTyr-binding forkhead associated (FHA) protein
MEQQTLLAAAAIVAALLAGTMLLRVTRRRPPPAARPSPAPVVPYLESPDGRVRLPLSQLGGAGMTIGRSRSVELTVDATLPEANTVADRHARLYRDATTGCVVIEDLNSASGVFINGRRAPHRNMLRDRWTVGLGSLTLVYRDGNTDTGPLE